MAPLICFVGVDGSGKTTSAVRLYERLLAKGFQCEYIHHAFTLTDSVPPFLAVFVRERLSSTAKLNRSVVAVSTDHKTGKLKTMVDVALSFIALIDSLIGYTVETRLSASGRIIIYDRYIYDRIIEYINAGPKWLTKLYLRIIPNPDLIFVLDTPSALAFKRKKEGSSNFRERQRKQYLKLARQLDGKNVIIVNTCENDIKRVNSMVFNYTTSLLKSN